MKQLPMAPESPNIRVLAQTYVETFTDVTGDTIALAHPPLRTVDNVGLEQVFKNGVLLGAAGGGTATLVRERFTGLSTTTINLTNFPIVEDSEMVFKNGQLLDDHPAQSVSLAGLHTELDTLTVTVDSVTASGTDTGGDDVTVTGSGSGTIDDGTATGTGTLEVEPARGGYTIDPETGEITLDQTATGTDKFTVQYQFGVGTNGAEAYTIDGQTLTLAVELVETDVVVVYYPYRT